MGDYKHNQTAARNHKTIGPTAALIAYYRGASDIPFAWDIAQESNAEELSGTMRTSDALFLAKLRVAFEARFKSVDAVLSRYPEITNFIEIPAGLSTRGLSIVTRNPRATYIECDFPEIMERKKEIVQRIVSSARLGELANLHFEPANLLDGEQLKRVVAMLPKGPVAVITEGLISYLTHQEKAVAGKNVRDVLVLRRGVWLVTDITRLFKPDDAKAFDLRKRISDSTGFSPVTGCFGSIREGKRFFRRLGFKVSDCRRSEVLLNLSTRTECGMTDSEIKKLLKPQATFALEVEQ
jgi:O-methyltransferase involved in polyketide biosynthesis